MSRLPCSSDELIARYGPHPQQEPPGGWDAASRRPVDRLVKTHCCFCGQQCGIQLKVSENQVIGFEPWEEFPFNRGMLCPKGVRRYLQSNHPDRLLDPLIRTTPTEGGFRAAGWDEALGLTAGRLREIQERHGKDAVAILGGASLTSEKTYLLGKPARVGFGTRHIDYNGRLCMVSAGTAYKLSFGVDRSPNPWSDIPKAEVLFILGANIGECAPITTDYVWRCRDAGGKLIVADPRMTPITRNADLYLPVRPGTDMALLMAMLHVVLRDGLERRDSIAAHTTGFEAVEAAVKSWGPGAGRARDRRAPRGHREGGALVCGRRARHRHARARHRAPLQGGRELPGRHPSGPRVRAHRPRGRRLHDDHRSGQWSGGREHGQKCDQLPGQRSIADPEARRHVAHV